MHRIDTDGHVGNLFNGGDPLVPRLPTQIDPAWLNAVQEELANAITQDGGAALVKGTNTQLANAFVRVGSGTSVASQTIYGSKTWYDPAVFSSGATIVQGDWQNVSLAGNNTADTETPRLYKDSTGTVHLDGASLASGAITTGSTVATLPTGHRPQRATTFPIVADDAGAVGTSRPFWLKIATNGVVTIGAWDGVQLANAWRFWWSGISFQTKAT